MAEKTDTNTYLSHEQYDKFYRDFKKRENALDRALDIRKFEIELYWKRATYFWTFIAATFAGYGAVQASNMKDRSRTDLLVILSCLGLVFSVGWVLVNKGSKLWQENWENHVDLLEDDVTGPLYKIVLIRPQPEGAYERTKLVLTGPARFSVSRINQIISLFVTVVWGLLLWTALPPLSWAAKVDGLYIGLLIVTFLACLAFFVYGRTSLGQHTPVAMRRLVNIEPPPASTPSKR
jgi:hypothetical protein